MFEEYYKKLELENNASDEEIKKAYKKMAIKYHPDKQTGKCSEDIIFAEKKFKEIAEAYEILTNKDKHMQNNFANVHCARGFVNPHEIFNQIFRDMHVGNVGNFGNIGNVHPNISIVMPGNMSNNSVIRSSSTSIQNGRKVETIRETINGVTRQRVIISDINNNIQMPGNII